MCNQATTVSFSSSSVCPRTLSKLEILYVILFSGNSSHSDCHSSDIYLFAREFKSEKEMSSTEMSPTRSSLAAKFAAEFPLMSTWPGTQINTRSLQSGFRLRQGG